MQPSLIGKCVSAYMSAKFQKCTCTVHIIHCSFQLKWKLVAVKHQQPLSHKFQVQDRLIINKDLFCVSLHNNMLWPQNTFSIVHDLKNNTSDFASHNRLHMYGFSDVVNLLVSSPGTACTMSPTKHESQVIPQNSSKTCRSKLK